MYAQIKEQMFYMVINTVDQRWFWRAVGSVIVIYSSNLHFLSHHDLRRFFKNVSRRSFALSAQPQPHSRRSTTFIHLSYHCYVGAVRLYCCWNGSFGVIPQTLRQSHFQPAVSLFYSLVAASKFNINMHFYSFNLFFLFFFISQLIASSFCRLRHFLFVAVKLLNVSVELFVRYAWTMEWQKHKKSNGMKFSWAKATFHHFMENKILHILTFDCCELYSSLVIPFPT